MEEGIKIREKSDFRLYYKSFALGLVCGGLAGFLTREILNREIEFGEEVFGFFGFGFGMGYSERKLEKSNGRNPLKVGIATGSGALIGNSIVKIFNYYN